MDLLVDATLILQLSICLILFTTGIMTIRMFKFALGIIFALCLLDSAYSEGYDGYEEWEVEVGNKQQGLFLQHMEDTGRVDVLKEPQEDLPGVILVAPEHTKTLARSLAGSGIGVKVISNDFGENVRAQYRDNVGPDTLHSENGRAGFDVNKYNDLEPLMAQLDVWVSQCPTGLQCQIVSLGKSAEGKDLKMIQIKKAGSDNKILYFEFTIHAREWLAATTGQRLIDKIIKDYPLDADTKDLVDNYDLHILLIANPDGYAFTRVKSGGSFPNRMWRKSRAVNPGSTCMGTDLNRNFDTNWAKQGTSSSECSSIYHGQNASSEIEIKNMQSYMESIKGKALATYAVHCCAKMWMFPYGYTQDFKLFSPCVKTKDHDDLTAAAKAGVDAVEAESGVTWKYGTICSTIYPVTGSTTGYSYDSANIKYSWAIEVAGWFDSTEDEIEPVFKQFWRALVASTNKIEELEK